MTPPQPYGDSTGLRDVRSDMKSNSQSFFTLRNRIERAAFIIMWTLLARWTPPPLHRWRCAILRAFGAQIGANVRIYASTIVWLPRNLTIGEDSLIGPRVRLYNQGRIDIGQHVVISQGAHVCASSHDVTDRLFQLVLRPIRIEDWAWIAADAFVGPGVTIGEGAVLAARGVAVRAIEPWIICGGNPAKALRPRKFRDE